MSHERQTFCQCHVYLFLAVLGSVLVFGLAESFQRTIVLVRVETQLGENVFFRGGRKSVSGCSSHVDSDPCAIPIRHRLQDTIPVESSVHHWSTGDRYLDWQGPEHGQGVYKGQEAGGTPLVWTTSQKASGGPVLEKDGFGYTSLNTFGSHYWLLDVDMDCSKTDQGWFEFKVFTTPSGGHGGWEVDIQQTVNCGGSTGGTAPYTGNNHMAHCGKINLFYYENSGCVIDDIHTALHQPSHVPTACGSRPIQTRIMHGLPAAKGRWPWMAEILYKGKHGCGAAILSPTWAVTAGHCVRTAHAFGDWGLLLRAGELERNSRSGDERDYFVKQIIKHPLFDKNVGSSIGNDNDIALLELTYPMDMTSSQVADICLPSSRNLDQFVGHECWGIGWGATAGADASKLQEVKMTVHSEAACKHDYGLKVSQRQVCAGGGQVSACSGDSGSPLSCLVGGRWHLAGVVSWGDDNCTGRPSIYTRIAAHLDWIHTITGLTAHSLSIVG